LAEPLELLNPVHVPLLPGPKLNIREPLHPVFRYLCSCDTWNRPKVPRHAKMKEKGERRKEEG